MNKRKTLQVTVVILSLVLICLIVWLLWQSTMTGPQGETQKTTESVQNQGDRDNTGSASPTGTGEEYATTDMTQNVLQETVSDTQPEKPKDPTENVTNSAFFPYKIPGTTLEIAQINAYDGIFLEDGSDNEISNVTAMVLTNTGNACIEYMDITMDRDGEKLQFVGSALAPGGTVILLEANAKQFSNGDISNCTAEVATIKKMEMSENLVRVEENADGGLLVTNISGEDIPCVRVFYKFYIFDKEVYLGGITYTAKVIDLKASESCVITPSHYFQGYSKIVMVRTYETDT